MIFKEIDSKYDEINTLKKLIDKSKSESQKALIKKDLLALENGYIAEKENAYYLDFQSVDILKKCKKNYKSSLGEITLFIRIRAVPLGAL